MRCIDGEPRQDHNEEGGKPCREGTKWETQNGNRREVF